VDQLKALVLATTAVLCMSGSIGAQEIPEDRLPAMSLIENLGNAAGLASSGTPRPLVPVAWEIIKHFEGWIDHAYDDPVGYCTIGYGRLLAYDLCANIDLSNVPAKLTEAQGSAMLEEDTVLSRLTVQQMVTVDLTDEQFSALTSFVFNVGATNFRKSTMLTLLNQGDYDRAGEQFPRWVKAKNQVFKGLVDRRNCEQALFEDKLVLTDGQKFARNLCTGLGLAPASGSLIDIETGEK
jgi:lysozyme